MNTKKLLMSAGIVIVAIVIVFVAVSNSGSPAATAPVTTTTPPSDATPTPASSTTPIDSTETSKYKDGTYSATGSYQSPGGPDQVGVSLTLKNDIITDITVTAMPGDKMSADYQQKFISGYKALVVGKDIDSLNISVVSGSSLTSGGFNDAINQIKAQAQA